MSFLHSFLPSIYLIITDTSYVKTLAELCANQRKRMWVKCQRLFNESRVICCSKIYLNSYKINSLINSLFYIYNFTDKANKNKNVIKIFLVCSNFCESLFVMKLSNSFRSGLVYLLYRFNSFFNSELTAHLLCKEPTITCKFSAISLKKVFACIDIPVPLFFKRNAYQGEFKW